MTPVLKKVTPVKACFKRKLPEKKERCTSCGRMFLNMKGLDIHKGKAHGILS